MLARHSERLHSRAGADDSGDAGLVDACVAQLFELASPLQARRKRREFRSSH